MRIDASTIVDSHYPLLQNYARFSHTHSMQKSHLSYLIATDVATRVEKKYQNFFFLLSKDQNLSNENSRKSLPSGTSEKLSIN